METMYAVVLLVCSLAVPVGLIAALVLVRTLRVRHPEVLRQVDPAGFRTFYLPSQFRFIAFVARGGLRTITDSRVRLCLRVWVVCIVLVGIYLFLGTVIAADLGISREQTKPHDPP